jgi:four helix bundle protein
VPAIKKYSDLVVWQRAMDLVALSYRLSEKFPRAEDYALRQQLRRAAVSIADNVAEGHGRTGIGEFLHHLSVAHGSLMELETLFHVAGQLSYLEEQSVLDRMKETEEVGRLLRGLMTSLRARASESIPVAR